MTQNERVLADVYETFRHNPQEQYDVDQLENDLSRSQRLNFPDLVKALTSGKVPAESIKHRC